MTSPSTNQQSSMIREKILVKNNQEYPEKNAFASKNKNCSYIISLYLFTHRVSSYMVVCSSRELCNKMSIQH